MDKDRLRHLAGIVTEAWDPGYDPQDAPIRNAKRIWSQIDNLLVDLQDEILDARSRYPENQGVEQAITLLNNSQYAEFARVLGKLHDN